MDRDRLKQIIIEEILKALAARGVTAQPSVSSAATSAAVPVAASDPAERRGLVLFTGTRAPDPRSLEAVAGLVPLGFRAEAVASFSFRQTQGTDLPRILRDLPVFADSDNEAVMEARVSASEWIIVADASLNTLNKVLLGIEDSAPSRVIAQALRLGLGCVFLESAPAPFRGPESRRSGLIRGLFGRGAVLASPENLAAVLHEAARPREDRFYKPPPARPELRHPIITCEDVYDAASRGQTEMILPPGAIITAEAVEDARKRGVAIRRSDEA